MLSLLQPNLFKWHILDFIQICKSFVERHKKICRYGLHDDMVLKLDLNENGIFEAKAIKRPLKW